MKSRTAYPYQGKPVRKSSGRIIGYIRGDTFVKYASAAIHMLRDPKGWAIDEAALEKARLAGVKSVVIIDQDTGKIYSAPLSVFKEKGIFIERGYGKQRCLPLEFWTVTNGQ